MSSLKPPLNRQLNYQFSCEIAGENAFTFYFKQAENHPVKISDTEIISLVAAISQEVQLKMTNIVINVIPSYQTLFVVFLHIKRPNRPPPPRTNPSELQGGHWARPPPCIDARDGTFRDFFSVCLDHFPGLSWLSLIRKLSLWIQGDQIYVAVLSLYLVNYICLSFFFFNISFTHEHSNGPSSQDLGTEHFLFFPIYMRGKPKKKYFF